MRKYHPDKAFPITRTLQNNNYLSIPPGSIIWTLEATLNLSFWRAVWDTTAYETHRGNDQKTLKEYEKNLERNKNPLHAYGRHYELDQKTLESK